MIKIVFAFMVAFYAGSFAIYSTKEPHKLRGAILDLERLPPSTFRQLPRNVVRSLHARGCAIPQTDLEPKPNNVISGEFAKRGQTDWAVLCSRGGNSSILVFWGRGIKSPAELAKAPDDAYWLGNNEEGFHYYRHLMTADRKYILVHYREYGRGEFIPPIKHDGIDDGFLEKGSEVYYFYRGKWVSLPGAD
jgi:hypothetical protein